MSASPSRRLPRRGLGLMLGPAIHHVGMYAGGGLMWSTNHTGDSARLQPIWGDEFLGGTRPGG